MKYHLLMCLNGFLWTLSIIVIALAIHGIIIDNKESKDNVVLTYHHNTIYINNVKTEYTLVKKDSLYVIRKKGE